MSNPTTPFNWQMPTNTDLVTDLPADFEVFGQAVATSMADLLGGTTGQILAKATNADMDFTWITNEIGDITAVTAGIGLTGGGTSGAVTLAIDSTVATLTGTQTLTNKTLTSPALTTPTISTLTTNGDLLYGTGSGAIARRAIGTTGQVLTVSGGLPTWTTPTGGAGKILQVVQTAKTNTFTTTSSTATAITGLDVTITPSSTSSRILIMVFVSNSSDGSQGFPVWYLQRGSTQILIGDAGQSNQRRVTSGNSTNANYLNNAAMSYVDSPASTSALTYGLYTSNADSSGTVCVNRTFIDGNNNYNARGTSTIIAMEVGP